MRIEGWSFKLVCKSLVAIAVWIQLWLVSPNAAAIIGMIAGLSVVAYWHENPKAHTTNRDLTRDFEHQVALIATGVKHPIAVERIRTRSLGSSEGGQYTLIGIDMGPVSQSTEPGSFRTRLSIGIIALASAAVAAVAILFHVIQAPTVMVMTVLVLMTFSASRHSGWLTNLIASGVGALALTLLYMPPVGSIHIALLQDRVSLALFIIVSIAGYPLVSARKTAKLNEVRLDGSFRF
jgi:K+-sensing histidine kinase KdpD